MKPKHLFLTLLALMASTITIWASDTSVDGIWYNFDSNTLTAEVTYHGTSYNEYSGEYSGNIAIPSSITYENQIYNVTEIGNNAFKDCTGLTSVTIPNSVTSIGELAFEECTGLTSITIPNNVTSIGDGAFSGCTSLTSITIPNSVTSIGDGTFFFCESLTSIEIPNSVTRIGEQAFQYNSALISATIGNSVTSIGDFAFGQCSSLSWVEFRNNITSIGDNVFYDCTKLRTIYAPCGELEHFKQMFSKTVKYRPLPYTITKKSENGSIDVPTCSNEGVLQITAVADYGYHFTQWSDGNTDNPRTIELTKDTTFEALFAKNTYTVIVLSGDSGMGKVSGSGTFEYETQVTISATSNYGYHFAKWTKIGQQNTITASEAYSIAAALASGTTTTTQYTIIGYVTGKYGTYSNSYYLSDSPDVAGKFIAFKCTSSAKVGDYVMVTGYITNYQGTTPETTSGASLTKITTPIANPYSFMLTQDTTIIAEFAKNTYTISVQPADTGMGSVSGGGLFEYLTNRFILATAEYGYHFVQWSDGNTDNPRTIEITQDTTFTAEFAKNIYTLDVQINNPEMGAVSGSGSYEYLAQVPIIATPNYGYRFVRWSDDVTVNLRAVTITKDDTITAIFEKKIFSITDDSNQNQGHVDGVGSYDYLTSVELTAINQYGYHFVQWSDGLLDNPRTIELTRDTTFEALFAKNPVITYLCDQTMGQIVGDTTLASTATGNVTFEAVPNYGYYFLQWSDGNNANPRTVLLTKDVSYTALFAIARRGTCGTDNSLTWQYSPETKQLTISGVGSLNENYTYGIEAPAQMRQLIIGNDVTEIGTRAFYGMTTINHLIIGGNVTSIGNYAFAECKNFDDITCYASDVPSINSTTFTNVGNKQYIYLFVPDGRQRAYLRDTYWGEFDVQVNSAEATTTGEDVKVTPTDNTATITWPSVDGADTYEIAITKDGEIVCTLIFNSNGQLTGIAFMPGRNRQQHAQTTGFRFTVTGLASNTSYDYTIDAKDNNDVVLDSKSGSFETTGSNVPTDIESADESTVTPIKLLRDNQVLILRGDKMYTVTGQEVK